MDWKKEKEEKDRRHFFYFLKEVLLTVLLLIAAIAASEKEMLGTAKVLFLFAIVMFIITCFTGMMWDREEHNLD